MPTSSPMRCRPRSWTEARGGLPFTPSLGFYGEMNGKTTKNLWLVWEKKGPQIYPVSGDSVDFGVFRDFTIKNGVF